ncbi:MAG: Stealth CR1 domain-containing protein [Tidjanibacter sp.]|nr:Stealth CR1 domain-containing protein [Tidjanibacter sp.]
MAHRESGEIDVVFTWVDGADREHRAKRMAWGGGGAVEQNDDIGGECRYSSSGEIFYAVGSILRFAPWVRTIHIITDNQNPQLDSWVEATFPNRTTQISIVDHRTIFSGYEEHLPTFNSISIETMMWRIPNLADRFLYLNDDMFLASAATPQMWFNGEQTTLYAERFSTRVGRLLRWLKPRKGGRKPFGYKDAMVNAATRLGSSYFWHFPHAPLPLRRSWYEEFYAAHPEWLTENIRHRFRHAEQYSFGSLYLIEAARRGELQVAPSKGTTLFLKPSARKPEGYMERKLREADRNPQLLFGCINSLSEAPAEEQQLFHRWMCRRVGVEFPLRGEQGR